jgi:NAD(P)-dependent dehydrogenase (short-subunit alcohol dehydrogenase family)
MRLKDRVVIITGAAGAIGGATARLMAAEGALLALVDRDAAALDGLQIPGSGDRVLRLQADVTQEADNRHMAKATLDHFGRIDGLFANAGVEGDVAAMETYPLSTYDRVMDINVRGVLLALQAVMPHLGAGASVVLTSSIMGMAGAQRNIAYTASKHAVVGLMRSAALEAAPRGIRVNSVHPGIVESPMIHRIFSGHPDPKAVAAALRARIKLGRFVQPEDIAHAVLYLMSTESAMVTSQTLVIDGGMLDR